MKELRDIISVKFENEETRIEETGCDYGGWGEITIKTEDGFVYVHSSHDGIERNEKSSYSSFFKHEVTYMSVYRHMKDGWVLNPNEKVRNAIIKRINKCGGQCPCDNDSIDKYCPCSNYRLHDHCCCMLYVRKQNKDE